MTSNKTMFFLVDTTPEDATANLDIIERKFILKVSNSGKMEAAVTSKISIGSIVEVIDISKAIFETFTAKILNIGKNQRHKHSS